MARLIEPMTPEQALAALADNERSINPAKRLIIPVIPRDGTCGIIPHVSVQAIMRGMDWENNCMVATPSEPLTVLTPEEVRDIQLSMRQGGNWHSFQRYKKQQEQIDLLTAQRDALAKSLENTLCDALIPMPSDTPEDIKIMRAGAASYVKAVIETAKPTNPTPVRK